MIVGAHAIIYSSDADADRAFLRDALKLPSVDAGDGWLIFALPPSEVAVHPSEADDRHELYLMCDDVREFVRAMRAKDVTCTPVRELAWGALTQVTLPGGGKLGVYQPGHARPRGASRIRMKKATRGNARRPSQRGKRRRPVSDDA